MSVPPLSARPEAQPIRVMIVDDSAIVRGMTSRWLEEAGGIVVAAIAVDGQHALKKLAEGEIDVCLLDIEMPVMSGLEALPKLLAQQPGLRVIMASTLSERGASVTMRALQLGACDFIPKPTANHLGGADAYRRDLIGKVRQFARRATGPGPAAAVAHPAPRPPVGLTPTSAPAPTPRAFFPKPEALIIASSTGGPSALRQLFERLGGDWRAPVLIAQHMPAEFTRPLARLIGQVTPLEVREAVDGEEVQAGVVYIAPGDYHMTVRRGATRRVVVSLNQDPQVNWCRPSADPLFASAAEVWGAGAVGLVLTGMGHDGRDGAAVLARKGGRIVAQDEATSTVWGMPGAVVEAGLAERVLPLPEIAPFLVHLS